MRPVERFTNDEARTKLNQRVRSRVEFAGVPVGTTGDVVAVYEVNPNKFDVVIRWDLAFGDHPLEDRFAKSTYEALLEEQKIPVAA